MCPGRDPCARAILTCQDLEDGGEEEAPALDQPEQLIQEGDEGEEAEEHGQDHEGLDRLDPVWRGRQRARRETSCTSITQTHSFSA